MNVRTKVVALSMALLVAVATVAAGLWLRERLTCAKAIQQAIADPQHIKPEELLERIDVDFRGMSDAAKENLLSDTVATENYIAEATVKELQKSFRLVFILPESNRRAVIAQSAEDIRRKAQNNPEKVTDLFNSPAGKGALRGASKFFLFELSGKEKAEAAPLTKAMYEIVRDQSRRRN